MPLTGRATVNEDIVGRKLVDSTMGVVAKDNATGLAAMLKTPVAVGAITASSTCVKSTDTEALTKANIYGAIVDAIVEFKKNNKVTFDSNGRAKGGWEPRTIMVGPAVYGLLQKSDEFVKYNADFSVNEALVGKVAGLEVLYAADMPDKTDFIIMSPNGFLAPKGVSATEIFDKVEGFPGAVACQAEMVYAFKVLDPKQILVHQAA